MPFASDREKKPGLALALSATMGAARSLLASAHFPSVPVVVDKYEQTCGSTAGRRAVRGWHAGGQHRHSHPKWPRLEAPPVPSSCV